jgi:hypothetical protein
VLVHCTGERDPLENANCDSRGGMFSALASFYSCLIGLETRNGARKGSVVAKISLRNTFGPCIRLWVLGWSGNTKRGSNAISGCRENCETLCSFSLPLMLSHEHNLNVPQFSWQPLAAFGSSFDFPHRLNILDHLHSPQSAARI